VYNSKKQHFVPKKKSKKQHLKKIKKIFFFHIHYIMDIWRILTCTLRTCDKKLYIIIFVLKIVHQFIKNIILFDEDFSYFKFLKHYDTC
jgi:hypothetical protein